MLRLIVFTIAVALWLVPAAEAASPSQEACSITYPLADLPVFWGKKFDPSILIMCFKASVDPESWQNGVGEIQVFEKNLSIVVTQTPDNHKRIEQLLELLRSSSRSRNP